MIKGNNCLLGHRWGSKTPSTWSFSANAIGGITSRTQSSAPLSGDFDTDHYRLQIRVFAESSLEAFGKLFLWNSLLQTTPLVVTLFYRRWWGALKGLKAIVLIFSNGHSLEERKEKSSITMMRKKKMQRWPGPWRKLKKGKCSLKKRRSKMVAMIEPIRFDNFLKVVKSYTGFSIQQAPVTFSQSDTPKRESGRCIHCPRYGQQ